MVLTDIQVGDMMKYQNLKEETEVEYLIEIAKSIKNLFSIGSRQVKFDIKDIRNRASLTFIQPKLDEVFEKLAKTYLCNTDYRGSNSKEFWGISKSVILVSYPQIKEARSLPRSYVIYVSPRINYLLPTSKKWIMLSLYNDNNRKLYHTKLFAVINEEIVRYEEPLFREIMKKFPPNDMTLSQEAYNLFEKKFK